MKLSNKTIYGIKALLEIALHNGSEVNSNEIAAAQKVPAKFLEQIMAILKRNKLVISSRGRSGGYLLAKKPNEITLFDVVELLDGAITLTANLKKGNNLQTVMQGIEGKLVAELKKVTLEELAEEKARETGVLLYNI
jgi:Rrf2 family transcriptional regulator, cysteine metabolism repressor